MTLLGYLGVVAEDNRETCVVLKILEKFFPLLFAFFEGAGANSSSSFPSYISSCYKAAKNWW